MVSMKVPGLSSLSQNLHRASKEVGPKESGWPTIRATMKS
jgi:hypothetical protein